MALIFDKIIFSNDNKTCLRDTYNFVNQFVSFQMHCKSITFAANEQQCHQIVCVAVHIFSSLMNDMTIEQKQKENFFSIELKLTNGKLYCNKSNYQQVIHAHFRTCSGHQRYVTHDISLSLLVDSIIIIFNCHNQG